jgi:hypothetical protein
MKTNNRRRRVAACSRHPRRKKNISTGFAGQFLRRTFYYLKGEQLIKASNRLLCEAA